MKVVVTGASGFVGSYVVAELLKQGFDVAVVLRSSSNTWRIDPILNQCIVIRGDITQVDRLRKEFLDLKPDVLIHLAWSGVTNSHRNDSGQIETNIVASQELFNLAIEAGVKTIVGIGSQAEYGPANKVLSETDLTAPTTMYGVAKLSVCHMLRALCLQHGIRFVWGRIFSSYGPMDHPSWLIPMLILKLCEEKPLDMTEGTQRWDYIYVEDAARAIVGMATSDEAQGIFNIGSGQSYKIRSTAEMLLGIMQSNSQPRFGKIPFRPDQVMLLQADVTKLETEIGWQPMVSLQEGLSKTVKWYKTYGKA